MSYRTSSLRPHLDIAGETNLKLKQAVPATAERFQTDADVAAFKGRIVCEAPNAAFDKFVGMLYLGPESSRGHAEPTATSAYSAVAHRYPTRTVTEHSAVSSTTDTVHAPLSAALSLGHGGTAAAANVAASNVTIRNSDGAVNGSASDAGLPMSPVVVTPEGPLASGSNAAGNGRGSGGMIELVDISLSSSPEVQRRAVGAGQVTPQLATAVGFALNSPGAGYDDGGDDDVNRPIPLEADQILLRGSVMRNVDYAYCMVVYTGAWCWWCWCC